MNPLRNTGLVWCALVAAAAGGLIAVAADPDKPAIKQPGSAPKEMPKVPLPDPAAAEVPAGYQVEVVVSGLTYPSSVEFDDRGAMYVAEAGNIDGDPVAQARVLRFTRASGGGLQQEVVADGLSGPVTHILWHAGRLYVSHRGKISVLENGKVRDLVTDLPSFGDHHNNQMTVGPDGLIYFGQGTATNAGVVGLDSFAFGWLPMHPEVCDRPAKDITLRGQAFETPDPLAMLAEKKLTTAKTSAFHPFGKAADDGAVVKGTVKANGTVLRMKPDGSGLEVYAWGLRNPFGLQWGPDGSLYASENGPGDRGTRPIANAPDCVWKIKQGAWYGWPDYFGGEPVTDPKFRSTEGPAPEFLMKDHPPVEKPLLCLPPHVSPCHVEFARGGTFGPAGRMYLAAFGDLAPITAAKQERAGYCVYRIDPATGTAETFFRAKAAALGPKDLEYVTTAGPRRPVGVRFAPAGDALYVADIGPLHFTRSATGPTPRPFPGAGTIWRVSRTAQR